MQTENHDDVYLSMPQCLQKYFGLTHFATSKVVYEMVQKYVCENNLMQESNIVFMDDTVKKILNIHVDHRASIHITELFKFIRKMIFDENLINCIG